MMTTYRGQVIWIIGASSGIGLALAHELSGRGATLILSARRQDELEQLRAALGAEHKVYPLDVTDAELVQRTATAAQAACGRVDRVIFLAAAYTPMPLTDLDLKAVKTIVDTNIMGAFNVVQAVLPLFKVQTGRGQLALCGSVAGYIGLPNGQPYSATKAAVLNLAESLRAECQDGIDIKLISPGFVRTPLTDKNDFHMPMMIVPERAAKEIAEGLLTRRFEIHFPKALTLPAKLLRLLPYGLALHLTRTLTSKGEY